MADADTFDLTLLSHSRLNCWLTCPRQFFYSYVQEIPETETSLPLIFGTAIHEAVEEFMESIKQRNEPLSEAEVHGIFQRAFSDEVDYAESSGYPVDWGKSNEEEASELGERMLTAFLEKVDRSVEVVGTEVQFEFELGPGQVMRGYMDIVLDDGNGHYRVVDLKTSSKAYSESQIRWALQPTIYVEAVKHLYDDVKDVSFEYWVLTKTKTPQFLVYPLHRTEFERKELYELADDYQVSIAAQVFPKKRDWQCNWCSYQKICDGECTLPEERTTHDSSNRTTTFLT